MATRAPNSSFTITTAPEFKFNCHSTIHHSSLYRITLIPLQTSLLNHRNHCCNRKNRDPRVYHFLSTTLKFPPTARMPYHSLIQCNLPFRRCIALSPPRTAESVNSRRKWTERRNDFAQLANRQATSDVQSRLRSRGTAYRVHIGVVAIFIGVGVSHFAKCEATSGWHPSIGIYTLLSLPFYRDFLPLLRSFPKKKCTPIHPVYHGNPLNNILGVANRCDGFTSPIPGRVRVRRIRGKRKGDAQQF